MCIVLEIKTLSWPVLLTWSLYIHGINKLYCKLWSLFRSCYFNPGFTHGSLLILCQYGLWSFQTGDTKLERFLPKNQHTWRKLLNFEFWISGILSKSAKIRLSKSIFYVKNHPNFLNFFFLEEYQSRSTFFVIDIF